MSSNLEQYFQKIFEKLNDLNGIDAIYFLDLNCNILSKKGNDAYLNQIKNVIKTEPVSKEIGTSIYSSPFHTYTLLNEEGLIVISKLSIEGPYIVVVGGENEPVDLINLLRIVKESRLGFQGQTKVLS